MEDYISVACVRSVSSKEVGELKLRALDFSPDVHVASSPHYVTKHYAKVNLTVDLAKYCFSGSRSADSLRRSVVSDCVAFVAYHGVFSSLFSSNCVLSAVRYDSSARRFIVNIVVRLLTD